MVAAQHSNAEVAVVHDSDYTWILQQAEENRLDSVDIAHILPALQQIVVATVDGGVSASKVK